MRNRDALLSRIPEQDRIGSYLMDVRGKRVLELGAANGYRLSWLKARGAHVVGTDASRMAVEDGRARYGFANHELYTSTTVPVTLPHEVGFDVIITSFFWYLIEPEDVAGTVFDVMESVSPQGLLVVSDFDNGYRRVPYVHDLRYRTTKDHFHHYFSWHPHFSIIHQEAFLHDGGPDPECSFTVLRYTP